MIRKALIATLLSFQLSGCITTSMQGYADRDLPAQAIGHIAVLVTAPMPMAEQLLASLEREATNRGLAVEDARALFPPTRQYTAAEVTHDLKARGVDGVLLVTAGTGETREYAGTVFSGSFGGSATASTFGSATNVAFSGNSTGYATPTYRYGRETRFDARLVDPSTGRNLWIGNGQITAGGAFFVGTGVSASNAASAIFNNMQSKGLMGAVRS